MVVGMTAGEAGEGIFRIPSHSVALWYIIHMLGIPVHQLRCIGYRVSAILTRDTVGGIA